LLACTACARQHARLRQGAAPPGSRQARLTEDPFGSLAMGRAPAAAAARRTPPRRGRVEEGVRGAAAAGSRPRTGRDVWGPADLKKI
jgi:hypothetical protein